MVNSANRIVETPRLLSTILSMFLRQDESALEGAEIRNAARSCQGLVCDPYLLFMIGRKWISTQSIFNIKANK